MQDERVEHVHSIEFLATTLNRTTVARRLIDPLPETLEIDLGIGDL